jgi:YidC/Oxa1 family membrane protein insertase
MQNDNKNTLMFIVSAFVILIGYQFFILGPQQKKAQAELQAKKVAEAQSAATSGVTLDANGNPAPLRLSREQAKVRARAWWSTPRPCRARSP